MTRCKPIVLLSTLLIASLLFGTAWGQNTRLQSLIQAYKEQNAPQLPQQPQPERPQPDRSGVLVANTPRHLAGNGPAPHSTPIGNTRDPLNPRFAPLPRSSADVIGSPYDEMIPDARLNDVFFVNSKFGWAVGDRGAIWHTDNGGEIWTLQETPVDCSLRSVYFLSESFGLAAGGYIFPYTNQGRGVVLLTTDAGKNWSLLSVPNAPVFHRINMFDPMKGILAGEASEYCPSGLFVTNDGGRNWTPLSGDKSDGWLSADFSDAKNGFGIGRDGTVQTLGDSKLSRAGTPGESVFTEVVSVSDPKASAKVNGWMVGPGGLVLYTADRGARWSVVAGKLPGNAATMVDLNTIAERGPKLWVAGNPGSMIYHSADFGKTWKAAPTGVTATIRKIVFKDDNSGWAVGELGTILSTVDGGANWKIQRRGGARLAMLGVFARATDIPLEAFVQICANQGYFGGVTLLLQERDRLGERHESAWIDRVHEAMIRTGAVGVWETGSSTLPRSELQTTFDRLVETIQKENDGKGIQRLRERLVATIRQWKPEIILTSGLGRAENPAPRKDPVRELLLREVLEAVRLAGDATAFPYQLTELGLAPWTVKKVHLALDGAEQGDVNVWTMEPLVRLGLPIDELTYVSRGMLETSWSVRPAILGFTTQSDETRTVGNRDFFAGIELQPGGEARRTLLGSYADRWEEIQQQIQRRRHAMGILNNTARIAEANGRTKSDVRLASHAAELTRKIDPDAAARILLDMGRQYHAAGDWDSAFEAFDLLARQHSAHPLTRHGFCWLLRYFAAEEAAWRRFQTNTWKSTEGGNETGGPTMDRRRLDPSLDKAIELLRYLDANIPDLADETELRFAAASALRRRGWGAEAVKYYLKRGAMGYDDVWGMRARAESWLATPDKAELPPEQKELPMPAIRCAFTSNKPYLDGQFDKQYDRGTWFRGNLYTLTPEKPRPRLQEMLKGKKNAAGLKREEKLRAESKKLGTQVMFLYDRQHLYIGVRSPRAAGFSYPPVAERPRLRDADLDAQDRIEILLDVDRDYGTYYSLTIDSRGWAVDACWGDKSWNPDLFIARHEDKDAWYVEAAIPWESLTDQLPVPKTVWALGLRRIVPDVGIECWNAENSFNLTEGLGFLVFE